MPNNNKRNIAKRLSVWAIVVALILMIPHVFNAPWTGRDFVFSGIVLFGAATFYELATKNTNSLKYSFTVGLVVLMGLVLVMGWAAAGPD